MLNTRWAVADAAMNAFASGSPEREHRSVCGPYVCYGSMPLIKYGDEMGGALICAFAGRLVATPIAER